MSSTLTRPQLTLSERPEAFVAVDTVMSKLIPTSNYLLLERDITTADFTLTMPGLDSADIKMALVTLTMWKQAFPDLGSNLHFSDVWVSSDGTNLTCVVDQFVTLARPLCLPNGPSFTAVGHLYHLRSAHAITTRDGLISSWRVSFDI